MNYLLYRRRTGGPTCRSISAASKTGLLAFRNDQVLPEDAEMVFRWGCTSPFPGDPEVVNRARSIHRAYAKGSFRALCEVAGVPTPQTWKTPRFMVLPCIVRPETHHGGFNFHVCNTKEEYFEATAKYPMWYASELIEKQAEFRVYVVSGRVVMIDRKYPGDPAQIAWNQAQGGKFKYVKWSQWDLDVAKVGINAIKTADLDFGAADVITDSWGQPYVLEVNSAPSNEAPYHAGVFAKAFDYIVENGKEPIEPTLRVGWKGYIHPAISEKAL